MKSVDQSYIEKKSNAIRSLFELYPPKGMSENNFIALQRKKIVEVLNINPDYFKDVRIENKNIFDYYTSSIANSREHEMFLKTFSFSEVINRVNLTSDFIYSLSENIIKNIANSDFTKAKDETKFLAKIIIKSWDQDLKLLEGRKFKGGNVFSHFNISGICSHYELYNAINKFNLEKIGLSEEKLKEIKSNPLIVTGGKNSTYHAIYFSILEDLFSKNINNCNKIVQENITGLSDTDKIDKFVNNVFSYVENKRIANQLQELISSSSDLKKEVVLSEDKQEQTNDEHKIIKKARRRI